jgi:hypothetical protein
LHVSVVFRDELGDEYLSSKSLITRLECVPDTIEDIGTFTCYLGVHGVGRDTALIGGNNVFDKSPNGRLYVARQGV